MNRIESRNETVKPPSVPAATDRKQGVDTAAASVNGGTRKEQSSMFASTDIGSSHGEARVDTGKRDASVPNKSSWGKIRPSIRKQDYIEYDFATMQNLNGGYINPKDKLPNPGFADDQEMELSLIHI